VISVVRPLIFTTITTTTIGVVFGSLNIVTVSIKKIISFNINSAQTGIKRKKKYYVTGDFFLLYAYYVKKETPTISDYFKKKNHFPVLVVTKLEYGT